MWGSERDDPQYRDGDHRAYDDGGKLYPTRVKCRFEGKDGKVVLDQLRTVDKGRLVRKVEVIEERVQGEVLRVLGEMFVL